MSSRIQNDAAVRADDEVVVLDHEVADRRRRHVQPQRLPVLAVVERDVDLPVSVPANSRPRRFGSSRTALTMPPSGMPCTISRPGLAAVVRAIDVRPQVVQAEAC